MQVHCPSCSTAYEIPPPIRPRRLRCARCDTEWRTLPPMAETGSAAADGIAGSVPAPVLPPAPVDPPTTVEPPAPVASPLNRTVVPVGVVPVGDVVAVPAVTASVQSPAIGDALQAAARSPTRSPARSRLQENPGRFWLVSWLLSLAIIVCMVFAAWHFRIALEHRWPESLRLFRLLPDGVPN